MTGSAVDELVDHRQGHLLTGGGRLCETTNHCGSHTVFNGRYARRTVKGDCLLFAVVILLPYGATLLFFQKN